MYAERPRALRTRNSGAIRDSAGNSCHRGNQMLVPGSRTRNSGLIGAAPQSAAHPRVQNFPVTRITQRRRPGAHRRTQNSGASTASRRLGQLVHEIPVRLRHLGDLASSYTKFRSTWLVRRQPGFVWVYTQFRCRRRQLAPFLSAYTKLRSACLVGSRFSARMRTGNSGALGACSFRLAPSALMEFRSR